MEKLIFEKNSTIAANLVVLKNDHYREGQHAIVIMPGIGEAKAEIIAGRRIEQWATVRAQLEAIDRRVVSNIYAEANTLNYNVVALGPDLTYTKTEILGAIKYAKEILKANYVSVIAHSLGGYGFWNNADLEILRQLSGVVFVAPGNGNNGLAAALMAELGIPSWFLTSKYDTQVGGNLYDVTKKWSTWINNAGGTAYTTIYGVTPVTNQHSILPIVFTKPAFSPGVEGSTPTPTITPGEFLLSNAPGFRLVNPADGFHPIIPTDGPPPATTTTTTSTTKKPNTTTTTTTTKKSNMNKTIHYITTSRTGKPYVISVFIHYTDGTSEELKPLIGDAIKSTTINLIDNTVGVDFDNAPNKFIDKNTKI